MLLTDSTTGWLLSILSESGKTAVRVFVPQCYSGKLEHPECCVFWQSTLRCQLGTDCQPETFAEQYRVTDVLNIFLLPVTRQYLSLFVELSVYMSKHAVANLLQFLLVSNAVT